MRSLADDLMRAQSTAALMCEGPGGGGGGGIEIIHRVKSDTTPDYG